jgi:uncharacterized protein YegL
MAPFEDALNDTIETLYDDMITSPRISEFVHVSILSYNDTAEVVLEMTDLQTLNALPVLGCGGVNDFAKAIGLLRQLIDKDVPTLNSAGLEVLRPLVFLLIGSKPTDENGYPSDSWKRDYAALVSKSNRRHPNVVPFGYGEAISEILSELSTIPGAAFLATALNSTSMGLRQIFPAVLSSIVSSAVPGEMRLATPVEGFIQGLPETVDQARDQVFISYSHADRRWLKELQTHLMPYLRSALIAVWDDSQIRAGAVWKESIEKALASTKVAVLLVSPDFLASSFIAESELPQLLEAAQSEGVTILWVPVRFSSFDRTPIADYQAAHDPAKPLSSLPMATRDRALVKICKLIQQAYQS